MEHDAHADLRIAQLEQQLALARAVLALLASTIPTGRVMDPKIWFAFELAMEGA